MKAKELANSLILIDDSELKDYVVDKMIWFARHMCELQKQECFEQSKADFNFDGFVYSNDESGYTGVDAYVKKDSILNCKNVCDE